VNECNVRDAVKVSVRLSVVEEKRYCLFLSRSALCETALGTFSASSHIMGK
jgi:hypothetical protein